MADLGQIGKVGMSGKWEIRRQAGGSSAQGKVKAVRGKEGGWLVAAVSRFGQEGKKEVRKKQ